MVVFISEDRPVKVKVADSAKQEILITGFVGSIKNAIIKLVTYNDTTNADDAFHVDPPDPNRIYIERNINANIACDAVMARQLARWLEEQVQLYESIYGKIEAPKGSQRSPTTEKAEIKKEQALNKK